MGNIVKYLWEFKLGMIGIILLLIIQAVADLSLPQYTSDIVDIGIQQGGIEHVAPDEMRAETMEKIALLISDQDLVTVNKYYQQDESGNFVLQTNDSEEIERLNNILGMPMVSLPQMQAGSEMDPVLLKQMIDSGAMKKEDILKMQAEAKAKMGSMSDAIITQQAILVVEAEYKAMGKDLTAYQNRYIMLTGGKMLALTLVMVIASILSGLLGARISARIGLNLRSRIFKKVVSFSSQEMEQFSTASLITRSTNDIQQIQMVSVMLLRMVLYAPILGIGGVIKVVTTKTGMGWIIGLAVGIILAVVLILLVVSMPKFKKMQVMVDRLNLVAREILTGVSVIRAFSREKHEEGRFAVANKDLTANQLFVSRVMAIMMPIMMLIMNAITVLIVWEGANGIDVGNLQVGDMMAFITYTMQIVMSFLMITMISIMLPRAGVSANRIQEVLKTKPTIIDKETTKDESKKSWDGLISFNDVSFRFPGADEDAVSNISFQAEPGKTTAIIGSTGCGKSTLLHLILRFYDVTKGAVTIDGIDIRDLSQQKLRSFIGFVPQKGVLFSGDIASNIKFSGEGVADDQMKKAAEIAQAMEFIEEKSDHFNSSIAQGGTNVSGGQKQRISIARAIAKQPKIFLFDDSFSALDFKTDVKLRRALHEQIADATILIVAQRISTIIHADQIIVLDEGEIVGIGTHQELLGNCESYQEIANSQLSEAELKGGQVV
jgi:ATP-binding cassette subfamily B protein